MKLTLLAVLLFSNSVFAKIKTEIVDYKDGESVLQGALVYDEALLKKKKETSCGCSCSQLDGC